MKLINRKSKEIAQHRKYARFSPFIRIRDGKYVHFPISAVAMCELRVGQYIHFLEMDKTVLFFANDKEAGFKLFSNGPRDASLKIASSAFIDWFNAKYKLTKRSNPSFYIGESSTEFRGMKCFEILTDSPRTETLKNKTK